MSTKAQDHLAVSNRVDEEKIGIIHEKEKTVNLEPRNARLVYLITYSRADLTLVPAKEAFSTLVLETFQNADPCSTSNVLQ